MPAAMLDMESSQHITDYMRERAKKDSHLQHRYKQLQSPLKPFSNYDLTDKERAVITSGAHDVLARLGYKYEGR